MCASTVHQRDEQYFRDDKLDNQVGKLTRKLSTFARLLRRLLLYPLHAFAFKRPSADGQLPTPVLRMRSVLALVGNNTPWPRPRLHPAKFDEESTAKGLNPELLSYWETVVPAPRAVGRSLVRQDLCVIDSLEQAGHWLCQTS